MMTDRAIVVPLLCRSGRTPAETAAFAGQIESTRLLLERSTDPRASQRCLKLAALASKVEMVGALLRWQAHFPFVDSRARERALVDALVCYAGVDWDSWRDGRESVVEEDGHSVTRMLVQDLRGQTR